MLNNSIVTIKKTIISLFLAFILVVGTIASISPSFMVGAQADSYLEMENNYEKSYGNDNINKSKDSSNVIVKKINCNNINVNVNGLELDVLPLFLADSDLEAELVESNTDISSFTGNSDGSIVNDFRYICINNNNNTVIEVEEPLVPPTPPGPPEPPTPQTASLTVNKEIFGCTIFSALAMNCIDFPNNSPRWISCNDASISGTKACQSLNVNLFDIEVLDSQNNPVVEPFIGSATGTTISNLQPGTYTVNEIESTTSSQDQLGDFFTDCVAAAVGFPDGGIFFNTNTSPQSTYTICFEYEDQPGNAQGDDCSTITLAAGESRTCTVKNYIRSVFPFD